MSTRQLADAMGVSESSVKRWVDEGEISAHRTAGGHRRIPVSAAVGFIRSRRVRPENPHLLPLTETPSLGVVDSSSCTALHDALLEDDAPAARAIICGRFLSGASIAAIGDGLLRPVLERIGELWRHDPRGILVEHRAVQSCAQALSQIVEWIPEPAAAAPVAVTAAGPADPYMLPPILAFMTLRECGLRAVNLGPATPLPTIELAMTQYAAAICVISVGVTQEAGSTSAWNSLQKRASTVGCRVVVGGRCVSSLGERAAPDTQVVACMTELAAFASGLVQGTRLPLPRPRTQPRRKRP
jgi:excisionase family DNA binding protein